MNEARSECCVSGTTSPCAAMVRGASQGVEEVQSRDVDMTADPRHRWDPLPILLRLQVKRSPANKERASLLTFQQDIFSVRPAWRIHIHQTQLRAFPIHTLGDVHQPHSHYQRETNADSNTWRTNTNCSKTSAKIETTIIGASSLPSRMT